MERIIRTNAGKYLEVLEHYNAIEVLLYREKKNSHSDVYGKYSGSKSNYHKKFEAILVSDDFFASSSTYAGDFEEGFMFTSESDVRPSDTIVIQSADGKQRRHRVDSVESLGTQDSVFYRYKLTNIGD